jgi:hypothetical protein
MGRASWINPWRANASRSPGSTPRPALRRCGAVESGDEVAEVAAPHKPLLLLWLFGRFAANRSGAVTYEEAERLSRFSLAAHHTERPLMPLCESVGIIRIGWWAGCRGCRG